MFWKLKCHFLIEIKSFDHMFFIPLFRPDLQLSFDVRKSLWQLLIFSSILTICCPWLRTMFFCWVKTQETLSPVCTCDFLPRSSNSWMQERWFLFSFKLSQLSPLSTWTFPRQFLYRLIHFPWETKSAGKSVVLYFQRARKWAKLPFITECIQM